MDRREFLSLAAAAALADTLLAAGFPRASLSGTLLATYNTVREQRRTIDEVCAEFADATGAAGAAAARLADGPDPDELYRAASDLWDARRTAEPHTEEDLYVAARVIAAEAGSARYDWNLPASQRADMNAIAHVMKNRLSVARTSPLRTRFVGSREPSLARVALHPKQFSAVNAAAAREALEEGYRQRDLLHGARTPAKRIRAYLATLEALEERDDPTDGALFYQNPRRTSIRWQEEDWQYIPTIRVGDHVFYALRDAAGRGPDGAAPLSPPQPPGLPGG